jgi:flavin-dependent dehydrogenase
VGGGPAGSTAAALLARKGLQVTLVERDRHPRFHIGESLRPMNMPIIERLGLGNALQAIGVKKLGADFPADNAQGYNVFRFDRSLRPTWPHASHFHNVVGDAYAFLDPIFSTDVYLAMHSAELAADFVEQSPARTCEGAHAALLHHVDCLLARIPGELDAAATARIDALQRRHHAAGSCLINLP